MVHETIRSTFKKGSTTFFTSSLFFPSNVRDAIFTFYAFVRTADDMVDSIPARFEAFEQFKRTFYSAVAGKPAHDVIIDSFVQLMKKRNIPVEWIDAFLSAMTADTKKKKYDTVEELCAYIYGSAEVIGLVMAQLINIPSDSYETARMLGRGFQYINFIRDIAEDITLGRQYIPREVLEPYGFETLTENSARNRPKQFTTLIRHELDRYRGWQQKGEAGFVYIPRRCLLPIKTAADMYRYTARIIYKDPFIIFKTKVKPSKARIIGRLLFNAL